MTGVVPSIELAGRPALSIVCPCYNEEACLRELYTRCCASARAAADESFEIVLINDGSKDSTWPIMQEIAAADTHVVAICLSRNFGHQSALSAGLMQCRGERVLLIDADLQDPPELLGDMMRLMDQGADVVYGQRRHRAGEGQVKIIFAKLFYRLMERLTEIDIPRDTGDFRLMNRKTVEVFRMFPEQFRFVRGLVSWIGGRQVPLIYDRDARAAGTTKYNVGDILRFGIDAVTGFSIAPLRIASYAGLGAGCLSLLTLTYTLGSWLFGNPISGWTSLTSIILIIGSIQFFVLGVFGEYLGRLYMESKRRPLFVIQEVVGGLPRSGTAE